MRLNRLVTFIFCSFSCLFEGSAQDLTGENDLLNKSAYSYASFMEVVKKYHPIVKVADLNITESEAKMLSARGGFDPKMYADLNQKYFKGTDYYNVLNGGVKIPTWFGLDFDVNYAQNEGVYLNPMYTTPNSGLLSVGASLNLGKGLLFDERRAAFKNAKILLEIGQNERQLIVNDLYFQATKAYWNWYVAYENLEVFKEGLVLAETRYTSVRSQSKLGDKPAIDTLEAFTQVQNRIADKVQGEVDYQNATLYLSVFLWGDDFIPLEVSEGAYPIKEELNTGDVFPNVNIDSSFVNHPFVLENQFILDQISIEKRLAKEMYKPGLKLKYNAIQEPIGNFVDQYNMNNYTWGFQFDMPLLFRKERGKLRVLKAKEEQQALKVDLKQKEIEVKVGVASNKLDALLKQLDVYDELVQNYAKLVKAENKIFQGGEGSLFLVNSRETKYIQSYIKYNELKLKVYHGKAELNYLFLNYE